MMLNRKGSETRNRWRWTCSSVPNLIKYSCAWSQHSHDQLVTDNELLAEYFAWNFKLPDPSFLSDGFFIDGAGPDFHSLLSELSSNDAVHGSADPSLRMWYSSETTEAMTDIWVDLVGARGKPPLSYQAGAFAAQSLQQIFYFWARHFGYIGRGVGPYWKWFSEL